MASDYKRDVNELICRAGTDAGRLLGQREIAYHGITIGEPLFSRVAMHPRPCTFLHFAELAPAKSIHIWHYSKSGGRLLGQQSAYVNFLDSVGFVGRVWLPIAQHERHLDTSESDESHVRFATTARTHTEHTAACRRHDRCFCGLTAAEAKRALCREGEFCHAWRSGACICQLARDEAFRFLCPAVSVHLLQ